MIVNQLFDDKNGALVLLQNQSLSWRGNLVLLTILAVYFSLTAILWAFVGAWMVAPFCGLELLIVALGLYQCKRQQQTTEHIVFTEQHLILRSGRHRPEHEARFPRHSVRLIIRRTHRWYPKRIYLLYLNQHIEIAKNLTDEDKDELIDLLYPLLVHF